MRDVWKEISSNSKAIIAAFLVCMVIALALITVAGW